MARSHWKILLVLAVSVLMILSAVAYGVVSGAGGGPESPGAVGADGKLYAAGPVCSTQIADGRIVDKATLFVTADETLADRGALDVAIAYLDGDRRIIRTAEERVQAKFVAGVAKRIVILSEPPADARDWASCAVSRLEPAAAEQRS